MQVQNQKRDRRGVTKRISAFALLVMTVALFIYCNSNNGKKSMEKQKEQTITHGVGRFVIDIPVSMQYRGGSYKMRNRQINEIIWPDNEAEKTAQSTWEKHLEEIKNLEPPTKINNALIETKNIEGIGKWCKAVYYYGYHKRPKRGYLDIMLNSGITGVWITSYGKITGKDFMYEKSSDLAKAYRPPTHRLGKASVLKNVDSFYLQYGAIDLPFEYKESVDIGFKGHKLDKYLEFGIETDVVDKVEKVGLMKRMTAIIALKMVPGFKMEKIRSNKREIAGLSGEEIIMRGTDTDDNETTINFVWEFLGKENSSHQPWIKIDMETEDGQIDEKLALWDSILDSLRPAGR